MADVAGIKTILYTEKSPNLQGQDVVAIQTSPKIAKTSLRAVLKEYPGVIPQNINSLRISEEVKHLRKRSGQKNDYRKFHVKLPEGVSLESAEA